MLSSLRPAGPVRNRGFTLIEVVFGLTIFMMMALVFSAVFPISITAAKFSNNYNQAEELCQHKLDELRQVPWSGYSSANFASQVGTTLQNDEIADPNSCIADGASGVQCNFVDIDNIANNGSNIGYFPPGATATINIDPMPSGLNQPPPYYVYTATATITWSGGGVSSGKYSTSTLLVESVY